MAKNFTAAPMKNVEGRYEVVDRATGAVLDDAQGYGFKTKTGACKCYGYKLKHA